MRRLVSEFDARTGGVPGRLRAAARSAPFHVALVEPEIPPNTGNIARLCAATCCPLHLVGKLGFQIDDKAVRRAGLDYWHLVDVRTHSLLSEVEATLEPGARTWLFSGKAQRSYLDVDFRAGDLLVFGRESVGLPEELLAARSSQVVGIPTLGAVRSLNLSNSVSIALYEALRKCGYLEVASVEDPAESDRGEL
jgi:tRNA (cytidine/uridine-2'-O-)-methyltransferase